MNNFEKNILIVNSSCWNCKNNILVALKGDDKGHFLYGPDDFSNKEKEIAREHGVFLKENFSKTRGEKYLSNTCKNCNSFVGSWYLFTEYYTPALLGDLNYKKVNYISNK